MKTAWKKLVSVILLLCLVTGAVQALAEGDTQISGKVRFCTAYKGSAGMDALVEEFNSIYPNIEVEMIQIGNTENGNAQIDTQLMAGEIDVLSSYTRPRTLGRINQFIDLRPYLERDGLDMASEWGAEIEFEGGLYGIPFDGLNYFIAINLDAWEEAGLGELPTNWTWDEYLESSRAMTKEGVYGGSDYHNAESFEYAARQHLGADMYFGEDGYTNFLSEPVWRTIIERKIKAENEDRIWKSMVEYVGDGSKSQDLFFQGKIASYVTCNVWRFIVDQENYPHTFRVGFAPYPTEAEGEIGYLAGPTKYAFACISNQCKDVEAAWTFVKFISMQGDKYLLKAGHLPTWTGTDLDGAIDLVFGSEEEARTLVDVDSFKRVVLNIDGASYLDTIVYSEFLGIEKEIVMYILNGEESVDEGLAELKERCDEVIDEYK